jgi:hypothetical protein
VPLTFSTGVNRSSNTVTLDINGLTEETTIASGDFVAIYDVSAAAIRKMTRANFVTGLSGGGGSITVREVDGSPSVSTVSVLEFAQSNGFVVTDQTGGVARVALSAVPYSALSLTGSIVNADVSGSAAIAYSKLNLSGSIVNADINASAAIADTKLATISTAGKVSDSALSSNVTLGGNTFSGTGLILRATSPTATNATINQAANNNTALTSVRATDTSPTGNFLLFRNAANNADLWAVDIAGSLTAGDVPAARLSGTIADARFPATLPAVSGANLTNLNASNLASGTVPLARLSGITNTEISGSAAIAYSKLAALTASRAIVGISGAVPVSDEFGFVIRQHPNALPFSKRARGLIHRFLNSHH